MSHEATLAEAIEEAISAFAAGTYREIKRVPYDMVDEYTPEGWVVMERHDTYVTLEKAGEQE